MRWTRTARLLLPVLTLAAGLAGAGSASAGTDPGQADGPGIITIEQLNMCMWGSHWTPDCFPNAESSLPETDPKWIAAEQTTAADKRQSIITQVSRHDPDVITINEGCQNDLETVAKAIGYQLTTFPTGKGKHDCTVDRGSSVNAILARDITGSGPSGYYGYPDDVRAYGCAQVGTTDWPSVRVCTTHLALKSQGDPAGSQQAYECAYLRDHVLDPSPGYVLFAGDVNMRGSGENCAPSRFHGLKDKEWDTTTSTDGLQHIYYSANGFWRQSCGWVYSVEHTDHPGFLLELGRQAPAQDVSDCGVREIR